MLPEKQKEDNTYSWFRSINLYYQGAEDYNQELSLRRAEAVKNVLMTRNVDPGRMETIGMGESMPIASNNSEGGRQMNRRVTLKIIPIEGQG